MARSSPFQYAASRSASALALAASSTFLVWGREGWLKFSPGHAASQRQVSRNDNVPKKAGGHGESQELRGGGEKSSRSGQNLKSRPGEISSTPLFGLHTQPAPEPAKQGGHGSRAGALGGALLTVQLSQTVVGKLIRIIDGRLLKIMRMHTAGTTCLTNLREVQVLEGGDACLRRQLVLLKAPQLLLHLRPLRTGGGVGERTAERTHTRTGARMEGRGDTNFGNRPRGISAHTWGPLVAVPWSPLSHPVTVTSSDRRKWRMSQPSLDNGPGFLRWPGPV